MKVLIAEDDMVSRVVLSEHLRKLAHGVIAVEDGRKAWESYQNEDIRMVISDWMMPEMDGLELCRQIRAEKRSNYTYIIMLTALSGRRNFLEGMDAGADDFIVKPLDPEELKARVRVGERILGLQQEVHELRGLLPICSYCKKIRDDRNTWTQLEQYVSQHSQLLFSHSLCPECYERQMQPQLDRLQGR